ncbi:hypothetical protein tb265_19030 [Gemmatimonadetes bacterium T265]|nr:hypothetical protein tb265_19030 [Gemmatimonadetes bacterium T265]
MRPPAAPNPTPTPVQSPPPAGAPSALATRVAEISCDVAARRLWDYVDGRLPNTPREELEAHLAVCAACPTHVAFARAMRRALAAASPRELPDTRRAALEAHVRLALDAAQAEHAASEHAAGRDA